MTKPFISILLLLSFIIFVNCEHDESIESIKYFPPEKLSELSLDNVGNFWLNDKIDNISDYVTQNFDTDPGHLVSIRYSSKNNSRIIAVSVFKSREIAFNAMEERRHNVACLIENGTSDEIKGTWWFTKCVGTYSVFVNTLNAIIEVGRDTNNYEEIEDILYTAKEISNRVDKLSE
jgi:hypothetical protein